MRLTGLWISCSAALFTYNEFKDVNFYCTTIQYEYFIYMLERVLKTYTSFLRKAIFNAPLSAGGCAPWNLPSMILLPGTLWLDS